MLSNCSTECSSFLARRPGCSDSFSCVRSTLFHLCCGLLSSSLVKMEAACSSETLVLTHDASQCCRNPEEHSILKIAVERITWEFLLKRGETDYLD